MDSFQKYLKIFVPICFQQLPGPPLTHLHLNDHITSNVSIFTYLLLAYEQHTCSMAACR